MSVRGVCAETSIHRSQFSADLACIHGYQQVTLCGEKMKSLVKLQATSRHAAPAIVVSSLGNLVHGESVILTAKDTQRAQMLRQVLKTQLKCPRRPRSTRGNAHVRVLNPDPAFIGEGARHRNLSIDGTSFPPESTRTLSGTSQNSLENTKDLGTLGSCGRGWKAQGMVTGEWRDRLDRQRRALPSEATAGKAAWEESPDGSVACSVPSVGTETSFESLVKELRQRLPQSPLPLMDFVVAQPTGSVKSVAANAIDDANGLKQGQASDKRHGYDSSSWGLTSAGRQSSRVALESGTVARLANCSSGQGRKEEARNSDCAPQLHTVSRGDSVKNYHPKIGQNKTFQLLLRPRVGGNPCRQTGYRASTLSTYQKNNATAPYRDCGFSRLAMIMASGGEASPSAALVAAAKAQERALPLLQIYALKIADP